MLDRWVESKRQRDFGTADKLRSQLEARGVRPEQARPHTWEEPPGRGRAPGSHAGYSGLPPPPAGRGRGAPPGAPPGATERLPPGIDTSVGDWRVRLVPQLELGKAKKEWHAIIRCPHARAPPFAAARIPSRLSSLSQQHVQHGQGRADERARRRLGHDAQRRGRRLQRI